MAGNTDAGIQRPGMVGWRSHQRLYGVQLVAVVTGRRIRVSGQQAAAMNGALVTVVSMTLQAGFDHRWLVLFPAGLPVDGVVTADAIDSLPLVHAAGMLSGDLLMAGGASDLSGPQLPGQMRIQVDHLAVAAGAGIFAVNRGGESGSIDMVAVAAQTDLRGIRQQFRPCIRGIEAKQGRTQE